MAKNSIDVVLRLRGAAAYNKAAQSAGKATGGIGTSGRKAERDLKRTERQTNRTARGFHSLSRGAKLGIGAIGGAAALGAAKSAVSATTTLTKTTMGLQRATKMDTETASQWAAQAQVRGIDAKSLSMSMGTLSKNMTLAGEGGKSQINAFDRLGISQKQLKGTGGDISKLLPVMADRFKAMGPSAKRTASMMALMGRGWQTITPLMAGGSKEMQSHLNLANKYGVTLRGKPVKSMKDLMQTQREMKMAQLGWQVQFSTVIAPKLVKGFRMISRVSNALRPGFRWLSRHATFSKVIGSAALATVAIRKIPGGTWLAKHILGGLGTLGAKLFVRLVGPEKAASIAAGRIAGNAGGAKIATATSSTLGASARGGKMRSAFVGAGALLGPVMAAAAIQPFFSKFLADFNSRFDSVLKGLDGGKGPGSKVGGVAKYGIPGVGPATLGRDIKKKLGVPGIPGFATGGTIPLGGAAWVGERGRELAINRPSGTQIIPTAKARPVPQLQQAVAATGGGGGDVVVQHRTYLDGRVLYESSERHAKARKARR